MDADFVRTNIELVHDGHLARKFEIVLDKGGKGGR